MGTYILRRLLITVPLLFGMTFVIFMIIQLAPGDFFAQWALLPEVNQRQLRQWKREIGADKPWVTQYVMWLRGVMFDIRFTCPRDRIADFEYGGVTPSQGENKSEYDVGGDARGYAFVRKEDGSFGYAFDFAEEGQAGSISRWSNPDEKSETLYSYWNDSTFQAMEIEMQLVDFDGAEFFLRIQDNNKKFLTEKRPIGSDGVTVDLKDSDYARYEVTRGELAWMHLRLNQNAGPDTTAVVTFYQGDAVLGTVRKQMTASEQTWLLRKAFPEDIDSFAAVDRFTITFEAPASTATTVDLVISDTDGNQFRYPVGLDPGVLAIPYIPFADISAAGVDLTKLASVTVESNGAGHVMIDEMRLVRNVSAFSMGVPNFGESMRSHEPVWDVMIPKLKNTVLLNVWALMFTWILALPIGIYSATPS
jgi:hypothetical protein